jgi:hypothetical protein
VGTPPNDSATTTEDDDKKLESKELVATALKPFEGVLDTGHLPVCR